MNKEDLSLKIVFKGNAEISGWDGEEQVLDEFKVLLNCAPVEIGLGDDPSKIIGDALTQTLAIHLNNRQIELLTDLDRLQDKRKYQANLFESIQEAADN